MIEESFHVERLLVFEYKVNGPAQLVGEDSQSLAFIVFVRPVWKRNILPRDAIPEHEYRGFLDRPFEMMVADLLVAVPGPFTVGLFYRPDQPGIG